jgi:hypothetical protein
MTRRPPSRDRDDARSTGSARRADNGRRGDVAQRDVLRRDGGNRRDGLFIGPVRITPVRVFLLLALVGSVAYVAYAIAVVRDTNALPMLSSGAAVLGIVFLALAVAGGKGTLDAGRDGSTARAFTLAVGGGIAAMIAFGCFAGAIILALVMGGT